MPRHQSTPSEKEPEVTWKFFFTKWYDKDQVKVTKDGNHYWIKAGRMLTEKEQMGAIVKYELSQQKKLEE